MSSILTNFSSSDHCQPAVSKIDIYVTVVLNVATDIYLISIPAPMLFKARLRWREKLELLVLFSGGLFVMMAGILRCVLILTVRLRVCFNRVDEFLADMNTAGRCKWRSAGR